LLYAENIKLSIKSRLHGFFADYTDIKIRVIRLYPCLPQAGVLSKNKTPSAILLQSNGEALRHKRCVPIRHARFANFIMFPVIKIITLHSGKIAEGLFFSREKNKKDPDAESFDSLL
ncbi:MAG: hypothetical protein AAB731_04805, partial [Patescibacteria group bacterium]